jgi:tetratricopeptide (TPR) repeat protein
MPIPQQEPQPIKTKEHKQLQEKRFLVAVIAVLFLVGGAVLWILNAQGIVQGSWSSLLLIIFTVLGVVIGLFQWLFPVTATSSQHPIAVAAPPPTPHIIVHVPQSTPLPSPSSQGENATYRGILGVPPPTDPRTIEQRQKVVQDIYANLIKPGVTAMALTGIAGVGKSTLAALVYRYAEEQRRAGRAPFPAEALWLNIDSTATMADLAGNVFETLGQPLPDFAHLSLQNQAQALFNALNTADTARLIIFDQFENLLDWQTGHALADRPGVGEWIDALNSQPCACRILLTTRLWPQGTREYPPTHLQEYAVKGLEAQEGSQLLRKLGITADEQALRSAVERCNGHAFALTLLASLLRNRGLSLATFFKDPTYAQLWTGNIARNLLDFTYKQQLDTFQRRLLVAFSVYREPVPLEAAETIIDGNDYLSKEQAHAALDALLAQHLLQASGEGRYQLHAIVASYAQSHFVEGDEQANQQAVQAAHARAARYYLHLEATSCPPREKRQRLSDVDPLIEAIWQYCQADQWQEAYQLMEHERMFSALRSWGGNAVLLELYTLLLPAEKWHAERLQAAHLYNNLGVVYRALGRMDHARQYLERALEIYETEGDRVEESWSLNHLGRVYSEIGNKEQAQRYYEQALSICEEEGDRLGEIAALNHLGRVYRALGLKVQEQGYYERALSICKEIGDHGWEATTLNNLGRVLDDLGQPGQAQAHFEQALSIYREEGSLKGEGWTLNNLGKTASALGQKEQARKYLEQALGIRREVDRRGEGRTLNNLGELYASLGLTERAQGCYQEALSINREVGDHEGEGKTLRNIGSLYLQQHRSDVALAALSLAKGILDGLQSPYRDSTQEEVDALRKEVGEEQFALLLSTVEPQAAQVVKLALA